MLLPVEICFCSCMRVSLAIFANRVSELRTLSSPFPLALTPALADHASDGSVRERLAKSKGLGLGQIGRFYPAS